MKLKRILALALSGVMAVGVLTACNFGGGSSGGNKVSDSTNAVRSALNSQLDTLGQDTVDFTGNGGLASATRTVARGVTENDFTGLNFSGTTNGVVVPESSALADFMSRYINYDHWTGGFSSYTPTDNLTGDKTFVTLMLFDGAMSATGVGQAVANNVAEWNLKAVSSKDYTFEGHVAAYQVTIPATTAGSSSSSSGSDTSVWVVGLMLEQTQVQSTSSSTAP